MVVWWQVKRDVPVLAVVTVTPAGVFACPDTCPSDTAMAYPFSQQLIEILIPIPQMPDVKNTVRVDALEVSCVDRQQRADGRADVCRKPDCANHAPLSVQW